MKPAQFQYFQPQSVAEVHQRLAEHGFDCRILAGGQSLVPLMNMRILSPAVLIDINRCREFSYLREEGGSIVCGALTRQREAEVSPLVAARLPLLAAALPHVGVRANRNFGTICGSLAHSDPLAELPSVAAALEARFVIAGARGRREVGADEFFVGALSNCVEPDEMLAEVRLPIPPPGTRCAFLEVANRAHGFAVAGLAALAGFDAQGRCRQVRFAAMGAGAATLRLRAAEAVVEGEVPDEACARAAAAAATAEVEPTDDVHASAAYRVDLIGTLVRRALAQMRAAPTMQ